MLRMPSASAALAALALALGSATAAAAAPSACDSQDADLPAPLAAWTQKTALKSASDVAGLGAATLEPGGAVTAALHPSPQVAYPLEPAKPRDAAAYGGLLRIVVDQPGIYRLALSAAAWIDLVRDGQAVASVAHSHGPQCSTIRKMVDFPLRQGDYVLEISASPEAAVSVLVAPTQPPPPPPTTP